MSFFSDPPEAADLFTKLMELRAELMIEGKAFPIKWWAQKCGELTTLWVAYCRASHHPPPIPELPPRVA